jgi:hypothetical protein
MKGQDDERVETATGCRNRSHDHIRSYIAAIDHGDELRAPVAVLSPTKRTAMIECFNNDGLHKDHGHWCGGPEGKHISGVTVADLARDGMFSVIKNLQNSSARLTERGQWFARTLIEAANQASLLE